MQSRILLLIMLTSQVCMFSSLVFGQPNTSSHGLTLTVLAPDFALVQIDGKSHYPGNVTVEVS